MYKSTIVEYKCKYKYKYKTIQKLSYKETAANRSGVFIYIIHAFSPRASI